jgi:hypothetical protein
MNRRFGVAFLLLLVVAGSVWWGIHPPRTEEGYRTHTVMALETLSSQVASTRVWLDAVAHERVLRTTAAVAVEEAETDASSQTSTYAAWQPPDRSSEQVRARVTALGDEVVTALGEVRIAAREGRWSDAVAMRGTLATLEHRLARLEAAVQQGGRQGGQAGEIG